MAKQPPKKRLTAEDLSSLYDRVEQGPTIQPALDSLATKILGAPAPEPAVPAPKAERPGFISRALNRAVVSGMQTGADIGEMLQGAVVGQRSTDPRVRMAEEMVLGKPGRPAELRQKAAELEAKVPEAQGILENVASGVGYMAPEVLATMLGAKGATTAAKSLGPTSKLARVLAPEAAAGAIRRNFAGAINAAPLVTIPGALSEDSRRSATGNIVEMLTGERPNAAVRATGDILLDTSLGAVFEKLLAPVARRLSAVPKTAADVPMTGPVAPPPQAEPLRLGAGAIPMGPEGWSTARQVQAAEQFAQEARAPRTTPETRPERMIPASTTPTVPLGAEPVAGPTLTQGPAIPMGAPRVPETRPERLLTSQATQTVPLGTIPSPITGAVQGPAIPMAPGVSRPEGPISTLLRLLSPESEALRQRQFQMPPAYGPTPLPAGAAETRGPVSTIMPQLPAEAASIRQRLFMMPPAPEAPRVSEAAETAAARTPVEDKVDYMIQSADDPTAQQFIEMRNKTTRPGYLSPLSPEELVDKKLTLKHNGTVGYVLDPEGDLQNLFNNKGPKGAARDVIFDAIRSGGKTLDAFDGYLTKLYRQYGFVETGRLRFNDEYAPAGWNFERDGRPDVVFMAYRGGEPEDVVRARVNDKDLWSPAPPPTQYYDDYDAASAANKSIASAFEQARAVDQGFGAGRGATADLAGEGVRASGSGVAGGTLTPVARPEKGPPFSRAPDFGKGSNEYVINATGLEDNWRVWKDMDLGGNRGQWYISPPYGGRHYPLTVWTKKEAEQAAIDFINTARSNGYALDPFSSRRVPYPQLVSPASSKESVASALGGKAFDIGGAFGASLGTQFGREALPKVALGVGGYELEQNTQDPALRATGQGMQILSALSLGYRPSKALVRSGAVKVKDALAQSPQGRTALNLISRDILIDPQIKAVVDVAEREMAKYRAQGLDLARRARALGPEGDRLVSDLIEGESIQDRSGMDQETIAAAMAVAQKAAQDITGLGEQKVATGNISQATFERRKSTYLKRLYAAFKGAEAMNPVTIRKGGKTYRLDPERMRNENLTLDERNALGEIREASVRLGETFTRGGKNIATARLYNALAGIEGVIAPAYKQAMEEAENARLLSDAARSSGDLDMAKAARAAEIEAKRRMKGLAQELVTQNDQYVVLPDTPALSFLRGAVVRKDAAEYLVSMPDLGMPNTGPRGVWDKALAFWKRVHTVYNPGTHVSNFVSNASKVHMGGLSLAEQPVYLARALKDLKAYGPATKYLAEAGVLERGIPTYGDMAVEGLATQKGTLRQLAKTTRKETLQALTARGVTPESKLGSLLSSASSKAQQAYAMEDGIYRVALFQKLIADGKMSAKEAAAEVERVLPGYDTRSPLLTGIKNTISPFILYPAKYIPSLMEDIMDHPVRWATLAALWGGMDQMSRRMYTPVDQRDLRPEQRRSASLGYMLPGPVQADVIMRPLAKALGAEPKKGEQYTIDVSRYTPLSSFTGSPAPGSVLAKLAPNVPGAQLLQPSGPIPELFARAVNIDPFTGRTWFTGGETGGQKARKILEDVVLPLVAPTGVSYYGKKMLKETLPSGNRAELLSDVLGLAGARPQMVRPGVQAEYEKRDFLEQMRAVKAESKASIAKTESAARKQELRKAAQENLQRIRTKYYNQRRALNAEAQR